MKMRVISAEADMMLPKIDNSVLFSSDYICMPGDIVHVRITDAFDYDLVGKMEGQHGFCK